MTEAERIDKCYIALLEQDVKHAQAMLASYLARPTCCRALTRSTGSRVGHICVTESRFKDIVQQDGRYKYSCKVCSRVIFDES